MRLIVLGPPGSDRAAVAGLAAARLGVPAIRHHDVVQAEVQAHTPAAGEAVRHMNAGEIVPERLLLTMIRDRLAGPDTAAGFVLDGFPNHVVGRRPSKPCSPISAPQSTARSTWCCPMPRF